MAAVLRVRDSDGNLIDIRSIKGEPGKDGADGKDGKDGATVAEVVATLKSETWTFTILNPDGSTYTVTKEVMLK